MLSLPARLVTISFISPAAAWSLAPVPEGVFELYVAGPWPLASGSAIAAAVTWLTAGAPVAARPRQHEFV